MFAFVDAAIVNASARATFLHCSKFRLEKGVAVGLDTGALCERVRDARVCDMNA
jgi:hypothetical protein